MTIPRRYSLAGANGIPLERERVYVELGIWLPDGDSVPAPTRVVWPDGRSWEVGSLLQRREYGRALFGNLCVHYVLSIFGRARDLW